MVKKIEIIKSEELNSHPVMKDLKFLNKKNILRNPHTKSNNKFKRTGFIVTIILFAFLYINARLRL